jgi:hypothetical protein
MAAPPNPKSSTSWTPAVPPPPVDGAEVGYVLAVGLGVGDGAAVTVGDAEFVAGELVEELVAGVRVTPTLDAPGTTPLAVADPVVADPVVADPVVADPVVADPVVADPVVAVEEKMAGAVVDVDAEQAESATEANTVKAPQPAAVSLVLSTVPAMVVRTFMEPPRGSGRWPPCFRIRRQKRFRILAAETAGGGKKRSGARAPRRRVRQNALVP